MVPYPGTVWSVESSAGCSSDAADPTSSAPPAAAGSESVSAAGAAFFALELALGFAGDLRGARAPRGFAAGFASTSSGPAGASALSAAALVPQRNRVGPHRSL